MATVNGTQNDDILDGTPESDIINGNGGSDIVSGDAGADIINSGEGNDSVSGGPGQDTINLGVGDDTWIVKIDEVTLNAAYGWWGASAVFEEGFGQVCSAGRRGCTSGTDTQGDC